VDVAKADVDIAQLQLDQAIIRMPWAGVVLEVHSAEGQFVRAGDPLITVADPTDLYVDVPIDRASAKVGDNIELKVEEVSVTGKLAAILPLSARLDPLRGLFPSIASGRVEVDNSDGKFITGQTVYSPMIPRRPVGEVPTAALSNADGGDGERKVQVIRDGVVRDVAVQLLGQVGEEHVWVSGLFGEQDELILRTSEPLTDGSVVTPSSLVGGEPGTGTNQAPGTGGRPPRNFLDDQF
jgi:multidrug efflux pump subunit AcrA (membrane-fusion protein)